MDQAINPSIIKRRRHATLLSAGVALTLVCATVWAVSRADIWFPIVFP